MSNALWAMGTKLYRRNPTTNVLEVVPQVKVAAAPGFTQEYDDVTSHDSEGGFREKLPTLKAGKPLPIELVWNPDLDMHRQLYQDSLDQTKLTWQIILPNARATAWAFEAYVSGFDLPLPIDKGLVLNLALETTGKPRPSL